MGTSGLAVSVARNIIWNSADRDNGVPHSVFVLARNRVGVAERLEENSGRESDVKLPVSVAVGDAEHAVFDLDDWRGGDIENSVGDNSGQATSPSGGTTEPALCAVSNLNSNLQHPLTKPLTKQSFRSVRFAGWLENSAGFVPLFTLDR